MCVQLLATAIGAAGTYSAAQSGDATPQAQAQTGATMQATGMALGALGDLAAGTMRARMARADAAGDRAAGQQRADRIRKAGARELGQSRAGAVASGVKLSSESVLEAERSLRQNVEQDAMMAILTGNNRARSSEVSADFIEAGTLNSTISGLGEAYGKWKRSRPMPNVTVPNVLTEVPAPGVPNMRGDY